MILLWVLHSFCLMFLCLALSGSSGTQLSGLFGEVVYNDNTV